MEKRIIFLALLLSLLSLLGAIVYYTSNIPYEQPKQTTLYLNDNSSAYVNFIESKYAHPNPDAGTLTYQQPTKRERRYCSSWLVFYYNENEINYVGDMEYHIWAKNLKKIGYLYGSFRDIQSYRLSEGLMGENWWTEIDNITLREIGKPTKEKEGYELYEGSINTDDFLEREKDNEYKFALFLDGDSPEAVSGPELSSNVILNTK